MVYLLIKTTSDGYDDNYTYLIGAYSIREEAYDTRDKYRIARSLSIQQIKDADEQEDEFYRKWRNSDIKRKYVLKGLSEKELENKLYELAQETRGEAPDYLDDDYVNYEVIDVEVDSPDFEGVIL